MVEPLTASRIARSPRARWASLAILLICAAAATFRGFLPGRVLAPVDLVVAEAPWGATADDPAHPANALLVDQAAQFVPWMTYAAERLRAGELPLWNPFAQLGTPLIGNGQSALFSPFMFLHLLLPATWSWTLAALARLFIAGAGAFFLAARFPLSPAARLLAALSFMLCGFNVVWLNHPHTSVICWLPWSVLMTLRILERPAAARIAAGAAVFALQFLGGHPGSCVHLLFVTGLAFALSGLLAERARFWRALPAVGFSLALGMLTASIQWLPLLEYLQVSAASTWRHESGYAGGGMDLSYLAGILFPYANGYPPDASYVPEIQYATRLPNTNEIAPGFVGIVPLALALFAAYTRRRQRDVQIWLAIAAVSALIAVRAPGVQALVLLVPGLNTVQNARLLVGVALALSMLAGFGLDALLAVETAQRRFARWLALGAASFALAGAVAVAALHWARQPIIERGLTEVRKRYAADLGAQGHAHPLAYHEATIYAIHDQLLNTAWRLLLPAAALAAAGLALRRPGGAGSLRPAGIVLGVSLAELLLFAAPYNAGSPRADYWPSAPVLDSLRAREARDPEHPFRFAGTFRTLRPEYSTAYGLADVRGYDAVTPRRYRDFWRAVQDSPGGEPEITSLLEHPDAPALALLNLRYLIAPASQPAPGGSWELAEADARASLYENPRALPRAWLVPQALIYERSDQVLERVRRLDFDPRTVALLDREFPGGEALGPTAQPIAARDLAVATATDVRWAQESPERVRVSVDRSTGGWLVLSETFMPGWTARIEAPEALRGPLAIAPAYGILRAVPIPRSDDPLEVVFEYAPRAFGWGVRASAVGAAAILLLALVGAMRNRVRSAA